jgi:hypothetical protein
MDGYEKSDDLDSCLTGLRSGWLGLFIGEGVLQEARTEVLLATTPGVSCVD